MNEKEIIEAFIDAGKTAAHPVQDYIFGGFIEHIGDLINHSLWSEVLDDRKFFRAVDSLPLPEPQGFMARMPKRNVWRPIELDASVVMDTINPFVGARSPLIRLAGENPRGIAQSGLVLDKKEYAGRIVIATDEGAMITATLVWGSGAQDRQTIDLTVGLNSEPAAVGGWKKASLSFACGASTTDGRLEITVVGTGSFKVGAVSLMPSDNIRGFRADTLSLMKEMDCKILRMPGGNFVSGYDWKNTVGESDRRPPVFDPVWNVVQPNDVGVDELIGFCDLIGVEPYWCVNTGFGEARSGAELVEYVNGSASTS